MNQSSNNNEEEGDDVLNESDSNNSKQFVYLEKFVQIERPQGYSARGFGFLLNNGPAPMTILIRQNENLITEVFQNYAQVVVVEPGIN